MYKRNYSDAHIRRLQKAQEGSKHSAETKRTMSYTHKLKLQLDDVIRIYREVGYCHLAFAEKMGVGKSFIERKLAEYKRTNPDEHQALKEEAFAFRKNRTAERHKDKSKAGRKKYSYNEVLEALNKAGGNTIQASHDLGVSSSYVHRRISDGH